MISSCCPPLLGVASSCAQPWAGPLPHAAPPHSPPTHTPPLTAAAMEPLLGRCLQTGAELPVPASLAFWREILRLLRPTPSQARRAVGAGSPGSCMRGFVEESFCCGGPQRPPPLHSAEAVAARRASPKTARAPLPTPRTRRRTSCLPFTSCTASRWTGGRARRGRPLLQQRPFPPPLPPLAKGTKLARTRRRCAFA